MTKIHILTSLLMEIFHLNTKLSGNELAALARTIALGGVGEKLLLGGNDGILWMQSLKGFTMGLYMDLNFIGSERFIYWRRQKV